MRYERADEALHRDTGWYGSSQLYAANLAPMSALVLLAIPLCAGVHWKTCLDGQLFSLVIMLFSELERHSKALSNA